jgi:hypothetical protein
MTNKSPQVALVSMPFVSVNRPSLATALLKAILRGHGVECDVHNLFISFAERIGLLLYEQLAVFSDRQLAGERVFVAGLFGPDFTPELELPSGYEPADPRETPEITRLRLREAPPFFWTTALRRSHGRSTALSASAPCSSRT